MAGSIFRRIIILATLAISWAGALPARAIEASGRFLISIFDGSIVASISDLFRSPALAAGSPFGDIPIDPHLAHSQRHEAGIARLGTTRHNC